MPVSPHALLAYALVAWVAAATPGPAVLLALRNGATRGFRSGLMSTLGNVTGLVLLAGASILGLGVMLHTVPWMFTLVKWVGAGYLIYLGWRMLRAHSGAPGMGASGNDAVPASALRLWRQGLWVSITNPKAILFFGALFPQFIDTSRTLWPQFALLMGVSLCASTSTLLTYVWLASRARRWMERPSSATRINRLAGSVLMAFGVALADLR
jgi:threonine/homoserine/homoserine lactone efflux protein